MNTNVWQHCLDRLGSEITNQQFDTWIRPLHCVHEQDRLRLMAPNAFVLDWVKKNYLHMLRGYVDDLVQTQELAISLEIGSAPRAMPAAPLTATMPSSDSVMSRGRTSQNAQDDQVRQGNLFISALGVVEILLYSGEGI